LASVTIGRGVVGRSAAQPHHANIAGHASLAGRVSQRIALMTVQFHPCPITCLLPWYLRSGLLCRLSLSASLCWPRCDTFSDCSLWSAQFPCRVT